MCHFKSFAEGGKWQSSRDLIAGVADGSVASQKNVRGSSSEVDSLTLDGRTVDARVLKRGKKAKNKTGKCTTS